MSRTNHMFSTQEIASLSSSIGANIQRLRDRRGMSTSELSRESGIARTTIHKLERGVANPTLDTMYTLARCLGVPITDLVAVSDENTFDLVRGKDAIRLSSSAGVIRLLSRIDATNLVVEIMTLTLEEGETIRGSVHQPGVVEHVVVLSGYVEGGPEAMPSHLAEGDYLRFPGDEPHRYVALGGKVAMALLMETERGGLTPYKLHSLDVGDHR